MGVWARLILNSEAIELSFTALIGDTRTSYRSLGSHRKDPAGAGSEREIIYQSVLDIVPLVSKHGVVVPKFETVTFAEIDGPAAQKIGSSGKVFEVDNNFFYV